MSENPVCTCGKCHTAALPSTTLSVAEIAQAIDVILNYSSAPKNTPQYEAVDSSIKFIINSFAVATRVLEETMKFLRDFGSLTEEEREEVRKVSILYMETLAKFRKIDKDAYEVMNKEQNAPKAVFMSNPKFDGTFH